MRFLIPLLLVANLLGAQTAIRIGVPAPDITVTEWLTNVPADTTLEGQYIVLEFWATWCKPCLEAVPHLNELQAAVDDPNLLFLSMTYESAERALPVVERVGFATPVVTDESQRTQIGFGDGVRGISNYPLTVLIDGAGVVRWIGTPARLTEKVLRAFLRDELVLTQPSSGPDTQRASIERPRMLDAHSFGQLYEDTTVRWYVDIRPSVYSEKNIGVVMGFRAIKLVDKTLEEIYRTIFPNRRAVVPERLQLKGYDLVYLNRAPDHLSPAQLEAELLRQLGLAGETILTETVSYHLTVRKKGKLVPDTFSDAIGGVRPDDEMPGFLHFRRYTLRELSQYLTRTTSSEWIYDGQDPTAYYFLLNTQEPELLIPGLAQYGIRVKQKHGEQAVVYLREVGTPRGESK